jgi:hypothetical protein
MAKKVMAKKTKKSAPKTRTKVVRAEVVDEDEIASVAGGCCLDEEDLDGLDFDLVSDIC